tara:strand:- start:3741 stop:4865 length:1125 start_codon:yes stop_codon:yes gene_type:complete
MNREPVNPDDPQLTAYALGEMSVAETIEFETRLEMSPLARRELESMADLTSMLKVGLNHEWQVESTALMSEVSSDDPQLTDYALGEMMAGETAEFEARLKSSPSAQKELDSMSDIMSMLSVGLKSEWKAELDSPNLEVVEPISDDVVVPVNFRQPSRVVIGIAAAAVAMLVAAFSFVSKHDGVEVADWGQGHSDSAVDSSIDIGSTELVGVTSAPRGTVPQLFMADEVDDISQLNLASSWKSDGDGPTVLDASYLDSNGLATVSHRAGEMRVISAQGAGDRIDSYLPPAVEQRAQFDGNSDEGIVMVGFRPELAKAESRFDREIRLSAEFQGVQSELTRIISAMPVGAQERKELESALERNQRALSELKYQFSQ